MGIRLGLARRADAALIALMSRQLIEDGLPWSWHEDRIRRCIDDRDCVVLAARAGRRLIGFAIMHFHDDRAHLSLLAVLPGYRRRGVAARLLEWLEASARTAGAFRVRLELRSGNGDAYRFYGKLGYAEAGRLKAYYAGREDAIRMERDLRVVPA